MKRIFYGQNIALDCTIVFRLRYDAVKLKSGSSDSVDTFVLPFRLCEKTALSIEDADVGLNADIFRLPKRSKEPKTVFHLSRGEVSDQFS